LSKRFNLQQRLFLEIQASNIHQLWHYSLHFFAMIVIMALDLSWDIKSLLILSVCTHYYWLEPKGKTSQHRRVIKITRTDQNHWLLQTKNGKTISAMLQNESYNSAYLIILTFKTIQSGKKISVPLFREGISSDAYRQCRAILKWWR